MPTLQQLPLVIWVVLALLAVGGVWLALARLRRRPPVASPPPVVPRDWAERVTPVTKPAPVLSEEVPSPAQAAAEPILTPLVVEPPEPQAAVFVADQTLAGVPAASAPSEAAEVTLVGAPSLAINEPEAPIEPPLVPVPEEQLAVSAVIEIEAASGEASMSPPAEMEPEEVRAFAEEVIERAEQETSEALVPMPLAEADAPAPETPADQPEAPVAETPEVSSPEIPVGQPEASMAEAPAYASPEAPADQPDDQMAGAPVPSSFETSTYQPEGQVIGAPTSDPGAKPPELGFASPQAIEETSAEPPAGSSSGSGETPDTVPQVSPVPATEFSIEAELALEPVDNPTLQALAIAEHQAGESLGLEPAAETPEPPAELVVLSAEAEPAPVEAEPADPPESEAARLVSETRAWMQANGAPARIEGARRFFKEEIVLYGLPTGVVRRRAAETYKLIKKTGGLALALEAGDLLYASGNMEEAAFAEELVRRFRHQFDKAAFERFDTWIDLVNNWASCDGLSTHLLGEYIAVAGRPPALKLRQWARSSNRWRQRAAAVSLVPSARQGRHLPTVFQVATILIPVRDDMVEKGVGWMLKEATKARGQSKKVVDYLLRKRKKASRLTLRYACEKLPAAAKKRVLG